MKKHLLLLFTAAMTSLSSFALGLNDFIYTQNGRFQIMDATNNFTGSIQGFSGFSAIYNDGSTKVDSLFVTGQDATVGDYFQSNINVPYTEGLISKLDLPAGNYIVSFKLKSGAITSAIPSGGTFAGMNRIRLVSVAKDATVTSANVDEIVASYESGLTIGTEWATYGFDVEVDPSNDYYLEFLGMQSQVTVADIQIQEAMQVADLRQRDYMINFINAYKSVKQITEEQDKEFGLTENLEVLESIDETSSQEELDEVIVSLDEAILGMRGLMDSWLSDKDNSTFPAGFTCNNRSTDCGIWTTNPSGRLHKDTWDGKTYPEFPHFQHSNGWDRTGVMETKELQEFPAGSYVFSVDVRALVRLREGKQNWTPDLGMDCFQTTLYVVNEDGDTVAVTGPYAIRASEFTPNYLVFKLDQPLNCKVGIKTEGIKDGGTNIYPGSYGGTIMFKDAALYYVSSLPYTKKQLDYIKAVQKQITTGRDYITSNTEGINNAEKYWGKAELQACLDTAVAKVEAYEAIKTDTAYIINTYNEYVGEGGEWASSTSSESGILEYDIYQNVVKDLIAANRKFNDLNDTLNSLAEAIVAAKEFRNLRVYAESTTNEGLDNEITKAENLLTQLQNDAYSEENVDLLLAEIDALTAKKSEFAAGIPTEKIEVIADIDFEQPAVGLEGEATSGAVTIAGAVGQMEIDNFSTVAADGVFQKGYDKNFETFHEGMLRVGNGAGIVNIDEDKRVTGSNILRASFDMNFGKLNNRNAGFDFLDENNERVAEVYFDFYNGNMKNGGRDDFGLNFSYIPSYGAQGVDNDSIIGADDYKTHFEVIIDYGTSKMYCSTTSKSGSQKTVEVALPNKEPIAMFRVKSNYSSNPERRCWFDNLKIEKITAAEVVSVTGDTNGDGVVTMADANAIVNYFLAEDKTTITNFDVTAADVNGDGDITMADANAVVNIFLGSAE